MTVSFAGLFPEVYREVQKLMAHWHNHLLKVSRIGMYLGNRQMIVLSTFGHKLILDTKDFNSLKPLLRPSPSDLAMCALFPVLHTQHSSYLYIQPSSAFHPINMASLMKNETNTLRVIAQREQDLFDVAKNLHLNDLEDRLIPIASSYWTPIIGNCELPPLQAMEPYSKEAIENESSPIELLPRSFERFEKKICRSQDASLELIAGEDFMNLRGVIIERASFSQVLDEDLESMALLNPGCFWLVYLCAEDPSPSEAIFNKLNKAKSVGYHIWKLPDFKAYDLEKKELPMLGKWLLLTQKGLV